jgi:fermentation-respiration switch protein FrsA (DUF1100 family)
MMKLGIVVLVVTGAVLVLVGLVFVAQRSVLFPAPPPRGPAGRGTAELIALGSSTSAARALYLAPASGTATPYPLVIFAHGNAELADDWVDGFGPVRAWGWAVLLLEYPGYGDAPGRPSEASIGEAARAAFDWAAADARFDAARIVAYGRSLGGGAAGLLAATRPLAAVVLESSFTSTRPLAAAMGVPGWLIRDRFDSLRALRDYRGPLLVVHGTEDRLVPVGEGRQLAAAVPGAEFHALPCGHNDCPRPWPILRAFLTRHGLFTTVAR